MVFFQKNLVSTEVLRGNLIVWRALPSTVSASTSLPTGIIIAFKFSIHRVDFCANLAHREPPTVNSTIRGALPPMPLVSFMYATKKIIVFKYVIFYFTGIVKLYHLSKYIIFIVRFFYEIQVFQSDGTFAGKFGTCGSEEGQLEHPHYIAVSNTNRVIVSDSNNHRIQVFDVNGRVLSTFGSEGSDEGQFKFPR